MAQQTALRYKEAKGGIRFKMTNNYMLMTNVKNNHVYSSKFVLRVVNLNRIDLATEEDKAHKIDYWARLFKAETWEELKMVAGDNEFLQEAAESLYVANADEIVRQQCRAREDAERRERTILRDRRIAEEKAARLEEENAYLRARLAEFEERFYSKENTDKIKEFEKQIKEGKVIVKTMEELEAMQDE